MTEPLDEPTQPDTRDDELAEYSKVDADTVVDDAIELFETGSQPSPILNPDDPPPPDADDATGRRDRRT
jgi:hypothetical protein